MRTDPDRAVEAFDLDGFFAAARSAQDAVPDALMDRVLHQAELLQPKPSVTRPVRRSWVASLWRVLGGSGAMAGLAAAGVAGLAIGFLQPVDLAMANTAFAEETWDLYPVEIETYAYLLDPEPLLKD